jgi:small subunit ribosomal protein S2
VAKPSSKTLKIDVADFLKAGVQFGHETKRWNPKMQKYIFAQKNNIHIIDISKSVELLQKAVDFLQSVSSTGDILFVGTKRQASDIVKQQAIRSGAYYIINRWPGGLLTNFDQIKQSLKKYQSLETEFQTGVEGRTKFEVSNMKKEWVKMNRLYEGIKKMSSFPKAIVIVDINCERNVITEAEKLGIPVIAIVDTNTDPELVDYPVPGNDDAISSLRLLIGYFADAVLAGNKGNGIKHETVDYSKFEVKIRKVEEKKEELVEVGESPKAPTVEVKKVSTSKKSNSKGILENIQKQKETKLQARASEERESQEK